MAKPDDGLVVAEPGDIDGHNEGRAGIAVLVAVNGRLYHVGGKEAVERLRRELTFDAYLGFVAVLAVLAQDVGKRVLVRKADFAAVNVPSTVHVSVLVETVSELAVRLRRVAERKHKGFTVGQRPVGHFPDFLEHARRFVKQHEHRTTFVVQPGESLGVRLGH